MLEGSACVSLSLVLHSTKVIGVGVEAVWGWARLEREISKKGYFDFAGAVLFAHAAHILCAELVVRMQSFGAHRLSARGTHCARKAVQQRFLWIPFRLWHA